MPSLARSIYEHKYFKSFFDGQANRLIRQRTIDASAFVYQKMYLGRPHTHLSVYVALLPAFIIHLAKLIKNLFCLIATIFLATLALLSDKEIAYQLSLAMILETYLIGVNACNMLLALISPFVNGVMSLFGQLPRADTDKAEIDNGAIAQALLTAGYDGILPAYYLNAIPLPGYKSLQDACASLTP